MASSCAGGAGTPAGCGPVERIEGPSSLHVLPGVEVQFDYSPPSSGPHRFPAPSPGVHARPIDEPAQVAALEEGLVILQYSAEVKEATITELEQLADERQAIVAPGVRPFDDSSSIAFTAWGHRQLCSRLDRGAATTFIDTYARAVAADQG